MSKMLQCASRSSFKGPKWQGTRIMRTAHTTRKPRRPAQFILKHVMALGSLFRRSHAKKLWQERSLHCKMLRQGQKQKDQDVNQSARRTAWLANASITHVLQSINRDNAHAETNNAQRAKHPEIYFDSSASRHMSPDASLFSTLNRSACQNLCGCTGKVASQTHGTAQ